MVGKVLAQYQICEKLSEGGEFHADSDLMLMENYR
jgi:hypothetical protein